MDNNLTITNDFSINQLDDYMNDSVGIILRTKKRPVTLTRALASIIQQSYKKWHIYLINDGGEQESVEKIVQLNIADLANKITIIHNEHCLGMGSALNCGLNIVKEDFLAIHDDDDTWHPEFLEHTVFCLKNHQDAVAVVTNCTIVNEEITNNIIKLLNTYPWYKWQDQIGIANLIQDNFILPISLLIRMTVVKKIGLFNENLPLICDWDYNLRLIKFGEIITLNKTLAYYHQRLTAINSYGNTKIINHNNFNEQKNKFFNSIIRDIVDNDINQKLLQAILLSNAQKTDILMNKLQHLDYRIAEFENSKKLNDIYQMVTYLKRKSFPLKRLAGRLRKRIRKWQNK
jgi:glycosyltransferase involved in cell wall biosynthesis